MNKAKWLDGLASAAERSGRRLYRPGAPGWVSRWLYRVSLELYRASERARVEARP